jgi:RimJ/RimL family protein N-acetyltransferase
LADAGGHDRAAYAFTHVPHGLDEAARYVEDALSEQAIGKTLPFVMLSAEDGRVVGSTRFLHFDYWQGPLIWPAVEDTPPGDPAAAIPDAGEIGNTWLSAHTQRTGANAEAKLLMLRHAFEEWRVQRITLRADTRNRRSRIAIERLGATSEGVRRAHSRGMDGQVRSTAFYSILREEWPDVQANIQLLLGSSHPPLLSA